MVTKNNPDTRHSLKCSGAGSIKGFTLIELMIVVAIIAIIAAIAYPSYINSVTKTKRAAAEGCLSEYANFMERNYTSTLSYNKMQDPAVTPPDPAKTVNTVLPALDCASGANTGANYTYSFANGSPTQSAYTIQAAPIGSQLSRDTQCGTLSVNQVGARTISGTGTVADCW